MSNIHRFFIAACFACLLPFNVFSEAPVVDDSENFALIDGQQAAFEQPVARMPTQTAENDEESALANDKMETNKEYAHMNGGNGTSSNAVLLDKVQGLQQEIQELRGQLEVQAHDLKLLQEQQLSFYKDLDARVRNAPLKTATNQPLTDMASPVIPKSMPIQADKSPIQPVINAAINPVARTNPADEQISYLAAYELVKNKKFDEALAAMQAFVTQHPQSGYTANAQYWLGELFIVKKSYPEAIEHFEVVLQHYPTSSKAAASWLKIGYALAASGKKQEAIIRLQEVIKNYPNTNTAQLAKVKLASLGV